MRKGAKNSSQTFHTKLTGQKFIEFIWMDFIQMLFPIWINFVYYNLFPNFSVWILLTIYYLHTLNIPRLDDGLLKLKYGEWKIHSFQGINKPQQSTKAELTNH